MKKQPDFFDFASEIGITKHIGSLEATEALIKLCHVGEGKYALVVGCGVGVTPCSIARWYGCGVVGVDILERMVTRSKERAKREGVMDRVEFRMADAQDLPFEMFFSKCRVVSVLIDTTSIRSTRVMPRIAIRTLSRIHLIIRN